MPNIYFFVPQVVGKGNVLKDWFSVIGRELETAS